MHRLLDQASPPTALFTSQNVITIGAVRALHHLGRQHEVALIGFDDLILADALDPGVTVMAQDPNRMGTLAAERLFARLDGDRSPAETYIVPGRLIVRGSGRDPAPRLSPARRGTYQTLPLVTLLSTIERHLDEAPSHARPRPRPCR